LNYSFRKPTAVVVTGGRGTKPFPHPTNHMAYHRTTILFSPRPEKRFHQNINFQQKPTNARRNKDHAQLCDRHLQLLARRSATRESAPISIQAKYTKNG
jgi:hypothetical protein